MFALLLRHQNAFVSPVHCAVLSSPWIPLFCSVPAFLLHMSFSSWNQTSLSPSASVALPLEHREVAASISALSACGHAGGRLGTEHD